jgi:hypothetical protein
MSKILRYASPVVFMLVAACGGGTPQPTEPSVPKTPATSAPEPASSAPAAEPVEAGAPEAAAPKKPGMASGQVVPIYQGATEAQTIGTIGAVFRTDDGAELRIPGGWFNAPRNVLFAGAKKGKSTTGKLGNVYEIHVQMPDTTFRMGEENPSQIITSQSDPFIIKLPLPKGTESASLAVETISQDPKTKRNKSTWTFGSQTKLETADTGNRAVFELTTLPDGNLHLSSQPASAAAAP